MVYADKTSYEGSWLNDMREGEGLLLSANEEEIYRGFFKADMFHGKGRLSNNQGKLLKNDFNYLDFNKVGDFWLKYEGDFIQGKKQGFGCLLLSNGEKFEGGFYNDLPDGKGKFTKSNGYVLEAKWKAGKLIRNI